MTVAEQIETIIVAIGYVILFAVVIEAFVVIVAAALLLLGKIK